jgi:hypothetical protein
MRNVPIATKKRLLDSARIAREREREHTPANRGNNGNAKKLMLNDMADYKNGTSTMQANAILEVLFREYVANIIKENKWIFKKDLVLAGAEYCNCSQQTTTRYLEKMTSIVGRYAELKTNAGYIITLKADIESLKGQFDD